MSPTVTLRPATLADAPALGKLGAATFIETFGHLYTPEDLAAFLSAARSEGAYAALLREASSSIFLASMEDGKPVGYAVAGSCKLPVKDLEPKAGEIRELYVLADYQRHRIGSRLLSTALDWLINQGRKPFYVGVWSENFGAQRLYARFGFEKVGEYGFKVGAHTDWEFILKRQ